MVYASERSRCGHARGNFTRLPCLARLHSNALRWRKIILRSRQSRYPGGSTADVLTAADGEITVTPSAVEGSRGASFKVTLRDPSTSLGMTALLLHQLSPQQIESTLRHQLFEGFAITREKELFPPCRLIFRTQSYEHSADRFLFATASWSRDSCCRDPVRRTGSRAQSFRHLGHNPLAHGAKFLDRFARHTKGADFLLIRIGNIASNK